MKVEKNFVTSFELQNRVNNEIKTLPSIVENSNGKKENLAFLGDTRKAMLFRKIESDFQPPIEKLPAPKSEFPKIDVKPKIEFPIDVEPKIEFPDDGLAVPGGCFPHSNDEKMEEKIPDILVPDHKSPKNEEKLPDIILPDNKFPKDDCIECLPNEIPDLEFDPHVGLPDCTPLPDDLKDIGKNW